MSDQKYDGYQKGLVSMVYNCFDKKTKGSGIATNNEIKENIQLADELYKPTNRKFYKKSVFFI